MSRRHNLPFGVWAIGLVILFAHDASAWPRRHGRCVCRPQPQATASSTAASAELHNVLQELRAKLPGKSDDEIIESLRRYVCSDQSAGADGITWLANRLQAARRQRHAVESLGKIGGVVDRDRAWRTSQGPAAAIPPLLRETLGDDFFSDVVYAFVWNDAQLAHVKDLPRLKGLSLGVTYVGNAVGEMQRANEKMFAIAKGEVTDEGMKSLDGLEQIESVHFAASNVAATDAGLVHLYSLPNLRRLCFDETAITDRGLAELARKMPRLESIEMYGTKTTADGVEKFKQALPKCKVTWSDHYGM